MNNAVKEKFDAYPPKAKTQLMKIRGLIFEVADEEQLGEIVETLKWGEPSYSSKKGSPIRMDWKANSPDQISVYFNCKTVLIETFKELYQGTFQFVGNREIAIPISKAIPHPELKQCLSKALRYHTIKHLPLLGA